VTHRGPCQPPSFCDSVKPEWCRDHLLLLVGVKSRWVLLCFCGAKGPEPLESPGSGWDSAAAVPGTRFHLPFLKPLLSLPANSSAPVATPAVPWDPFPGPEQRCSPFGVFHPVLGQLWHGKHGNQKIDHKPQKQIKKTKK